MNEFEKARLYEEIKNCAIEEFGTKIEDEDLDEYEQDRLSEILRMMNDIANCGHGEWVFSYIEETLIEFFEAIFRYEEHSIFYDYNTYSIEDVVENQLCNKYGLIDCGVLHEISEYLDCENYAKECLNVRETEYGYIIIK